MVVLQIVLSIILVGYVTWTNVKDTGETESEYK